MEKEIKEILLRYFIGVVVAIIALFVPLFYFIFRPLTVWPTFLILDIFYDVSLNALDNIVVEGFTIEFIDACIAGSAYFLLFLLNVLTFGIGLKKRFFIFIFNAALLLIMNILRLVILIVLVVNGSAIFDVTHKVFWYGISTGYVALIWILTVVVFKIKAIPFISDIRLILSKKR
ncbi:MAG: pacearchaeosortase [Candidatus Pacearchaeota archaeon]|nr:MAG: pacearchaeosortase [Candidatus Pacearchaeota archaeon]